MWNSARVAGVVTASIVLLVVSASSAFASDPDGTVVISEIHYNPAGDEPGLEFIELHNPGTVAVDLSGARFTTGVKASLDGVTIAAGAYVILAPEQNAATSTYGVSPATTYLGKLSNGGETVTLKQDGVELDSVTYGDTGDWPLRADGNGASLELLAHSDNSLPSSWYSSDSKPTPGAANNELVVPDAELTDLSVTPPAPNVDEPVTVSVRATGGGVPVLTYVIGFSAPVSLEMTASVAGTDFSQSIPGQAAGQLIRYRIELSGSESIPESLDSRTYLGIVVADPDAATAGAPVFHLFVDEAQYAKMMDNPTNRELSADAVFAYDGAVFDNSLVEIRGGNFGREQSEKQSLNVDLPAGYELTVPEILEYPIDEFALNTDWGDPTMGKAATGWWFFEQAGFPAVGSSLVRLELNSDFGGIYRFQQKLDGAWRDAVGFDGGAFYKNRGGWRSEGGFEQKSGEDSQATVAEISAQLATDASPQKTAFLFSTFDIKNLVNYMAVATIVGHYDGTLRNFYLYQDSSAPNLWSLQPWDLDQTFGKKFAGCNATLATDLRCLEDPLFDAVYEIPELDAMVWARTATLLDEILAGTTIEEMHQARVDSIGAATEQLETQLWGRKPPSAQTASFNEGVDLVRGKFATERRVPAMGDAAAIVITELLYKPGGNGPEILELFNAGDEPVDISGWTIGAVFGDDEFIPGGTVVLPGQLVVLTDSVIELRSTYPEILNVVVVEYNGGLKSAGELVELIDRDGHIVDSVDYSSAAPWPVDAGDGAHSLELVDYSADNSQASSWTSSPNVGGSPGQVNAFVQSPVSAGEQATTSAEASAGGIPYVPIVIIALMVLVTAGGLTRTRLNRA
jgi:CotH kinase protein/Lamin Tail Domain